MAVVSIGIPTYNRPAMLQQAIQSVLQQTWEDIEIIVVDDCSTADTRRVVQTFQDPRIRYFRTDVNLRPPRSWNVCVRQASGDFFGILPDDDIYCPGFVAEMVHCLSDNPQIGFGQCSLYFVDEELRCLGTLEPSAHTFSMSGEDALIWQIERLACLPAAVLFRRSAMFDAGLWREYYWDDWSFMVRVAYRSGFTFIPKLLTCNRVHQGNLNRVMRGQRDIVLDRINQEADVFATALPATPRLIELRAKLNRRVSHHCMIAMLGAVRRGDLAGARTHFARARNLYPLAGLDLGFLGLLKSIMAENREQARRRRAPRSESPVVTLYDLT